MKLKKLILTGLAALSLGSLKAQDVQSQQSSAIADTLKQEITVDTMQQDSMDNETINPFTITSAYAGQITAVSAPIDDLKTASTSSSTRVGMGAKYNLTKNLSLNSWGIVDYSPDGSFALGQYFLQAIPTKNVVINLGNTAAAQTLNRPFPVSLSGHFETSADKLIPGGANGVRVDLSHPLSVEQGDAKLTGSASVVSRGGAAEYGLNAGVAHTISENTTNKLNIAGWYQDADVYGLVVSGSYRAVSGTIAYNETVGQSRVGHKLLGTITLPGKSGTVLPYFVQVWDLEAQENKRTNAELGVLGIGETTIGNTPIEITTGPGYDMVNKKVVGYLHVALQL